MSSSPGNTVYIVASNVLSYMTCNFKTVQCNITSSITLEWTESFNCTLTLSQFEVFMLLTWLYLSTSSLLTSVLQLQVDSLFIHSGFIFPWIKDFINPLKLVVNISSPLFQNWALLSLLCFISVINKIVLILKNCISMMKYTWSIIHYKTHILKSNHTKILINS